MKSLYIVGFMGTGKTAVSCELAKQTGRKRLDLDSMIEAKEGRKITQIFSESGEGYFRKVEKEVLEEASQQKELIVDCGGGIVLNKDNIDLMKKTGIMVCLTAEPDVILERTKKYKHRPLLNVTDPKKKIQELLDFRKRFYEQANYVIDTSELDIKQVVEKITEEVINKNLC